MKQYKVLKEMINAPVGTILTVDSFGELNTSGGLLVSITCVSEAIDQEFIEPYTPEPKRWRAEKYTTYYYVCTMLDTIEARADQQLEFDNNKYNSGNYFKSQTTAELVAKAQKLLFEWLHTNKNIELEADWLYATNEARKAVLQDNSNE